MLNLTKAFETTQGSHEPAPAPRSPSIRESSRRAHVYVARLAERYPERTAAERLKGCEELFMNAPTVFADETNDEMEAAILRHAAGEITDAEMLAALKRFADAHVCVWRDGVPGWRSERAA